MAKIHAPRKRRTRQHVIADQSINYVEGVVLDEGHTAERFQHDYGYDRLIITYDDFGYIEPGSIRLQIKATETLVAANASYAFDLDVRDVNLWMAERSLVILLLFDASQKRAYWLDIQKYFRDDLTRLPKQGAKFVRVHVPTRQRWNRRAVAKLRMLKMKTFRQAKEKKHATD